MRAMVAPWQHVIPFVRAGIGRGVSAGRGLPRQGDYDLAVDDLDAALERVTALGGRIVHPGARWAICKDSEGTPFALSAR